MIGVRDVLNDAFQPVLTMSVIHISKVAERSFYLQFMLVFGFHNSPSQICPG